MKRVDLVAVVVAFGALACGGTPEKPSATQAREASFPPAISPYEPHVVASDFGGVIDNPYFPLEPGTTYRYRGVTDEGIETDVVTVTTETKEIMGVTCTVVKDVVSTKGAIAEKTFDWYAQDGSGNVWYFGEDSAEYENGKPHSTKGSWEAGVDGALPGILMPGDPRPGQRYRQEYAAGEAEDVGHVIDVGTSLQIPFGSYDDVVVTEDSSLVERNLLEHKYYARGIGVVMERNVKGPKEVVKLVEINA